MTKCNQCSVKFVPSKSISKYCSPKCRRKFNRVKTFKKYEHLRKNKKLKDRYGITLVQYNEMVKKQSGKCAICENECKLHVDHCHVTGVVRGLLCNGCNRAIGFFNDEPRKLLKAVSYIVKAKLR